MLAICAYLPALTGDFVWDDRLLITNNADVLASDGWWRSWIDPRGVDYFPLTTLTFWIEYRLWGENTTGYHATNILLHAAVAVLSWRTLVRLNVPAAWLAAALFAVHPVGVESVAWIAERKNVLSQLLFVITILAYLRFERTERRTHYAVALLAFLAALLAKTTVVVLPAVLLLIAWWLRGRIAKRDVMRVLPMFFVALCMGAITLWFQYSRAIGDEMNVAVPVGARLLNAGFALAFYLYKALVPHGLLAIYPEWHLTLPWWQRLLPGLVVIAALAPLAYMALVRRASWARAGLFGLTYFTLGLLPVLGLLEMAYMRATLVADHFQYLSLIGLTSVVAAAAHRFLPSRAFIGGSTALLAILFLLSWRHAATYQNSETLWTHTLDGNPDAWIGHYNLGVALSERGERADALHHFREAQARRPNDVANQSSFALALAANGEYAAAVPELQRALVLYDDPRLRLELANALTRLRRMDEALVEYQRTLRSMPDDIGALFNSGRILEMQGRAADALPYFRRILDIDPNMAAARARIDAIEKSSGVDR